MLSFPSNQLRDVYQASKGFLLKHGIESAALDARLLIQEVCELTKEDFILQSEKKLLSGDIDNLSLKLQERASGRPVSKILGRKEFYGREFFVNEDVLDPRPETEHLIERVLDLTDKDQSFTFVDLGTGSGCIAITIASERPNARGVAIDISSKALAVAQENAHKFGITEDRLSFRQGSWCDPVTGKYDFILSNPPYIESDVIENLSKDVQNHDPILALDGGKLGIDPYIEILDHGFLHLNPHGRMVLEIGKGQEKRIARLVEERYATLEALLPDLAGILRIVDISNGDK